MDFEAFRMMFPVFGDDKKYPDDFLEMWADASSLHLRKGWSLSGKTYDYALNLMMAHLIYISGKAAENNGSGMVSSASEGSVSVSFATPTTKNGWEFWPLLLMVCNCGRCSNNLAQVGKLWVDYLSVLRFEK